MYKNLSEGKLNNKVWVCTGQVFWAVTGEG